MYIEVKKMNPINEISLIISEMITGFSNINMGNYVKIAFILLGILLMVLIIRIITNNIKRG